MDNGGQDKPHSSFYVRNKNGKALDITNARLAAYNNLIEKHSIKRIVFGNATKFNTVVIYMSEVKNGGEAINQGYEYRRNPELKYDNWIETNDPLLETAKKHFGSFVTKPINENWNLLTLIQ